MKIVTFVTNPISGARGERLLQSRERNKKKGRDEKKIEAE